MIGFLRTLRSIYRMSQRLETLQSEVNELEQHLKDSVNNYSKEFEKRIQQMTFAYTQNLDDTKSDYLKRYLEVRMDCIQNEVSALPHRLVAMEHDLQRLMLEKDEEE